MALYEGIALIQEKQAVVLDLGTDYTKFGFTGEAAPRCIVRSEFWCTARRAIRRVHDYDTPEELYDNLVNMLHLLYFRHVLVNPKERKVVVVESLLTPTLFRETLAKVLFIHYEVSGVVWADTPRLCALTLGTPITLVVSIGAVEAEVAAVVHGVVVVPGVRAGPLGARGARGELARRLRGENGDLEIPSHVLEDIAVKTCFVTTLTRALQWQSSTPPTPCPSVKYPTRGGTILISGETRELSAEYMFVRDAEFTSLPDLILQCIIASPIDVRRALAGNILLAGGGAAMPGLQARLAAELKQLVQEEPYNQKLFVKEFAFHKAPCHVNSTAWCGGAVGGAGGPGGTHTREQYARVPRLRDWVCLLHNTPPDHPQRNM